MMSRERGPTARKRGLPTSVAQWYASISPRGERPVEPGANTIMIALSRRFWVFSGLFLVFFGLSVASCTDPNRRAGDCDAGLLPGDVVITEIMANPKGPDSGKEWFEIYNATDEPIDLAGARLVSSREDGSSTKTHLMESLLIEPGAYAIVGSMLPEFVLPFVDYGYGTSLGDLRNGSGRVAVACGQAIIDEVIYVDMKDGVSQGFDGARVPDAIANDDISAWCHSTIEYAADEFGSPGESNEPCGTSTPTTCMEDGVSRDVVPVQHGDVVITEIMANAGVVADADGEWFEVYVARDVDLNGLQIGERGTVRRTLGGGQCLRVTAGTHLLFARKDDPSVNGGLPPVDFTFSFNLVNSDGEVFLSRDDELLDAVGYGSSVNGVSSNLDPRYYDPDLNDDRGVWCRGTTPFGDGDLGTPGAPNVECDVAPPDGLCNDDGVNRMPVAPEAGDLVITEIMANAGAVGDTDGEWFEIFATADVDLNGLQLYDRGALKNTLVSGRCLRVAAGSHVLFARKDDPAINGGLPEVDHLFTFNLVNSSGALAIGHGGEVLDEISWASSKNGISRSLDPGFYDAEANDDPSLWCDGSTAFGAGDFGTPGELNPACGVVTPGTCLDGGHERPTVKPQVGDLVITEMMPNSSAVNDTAGEWFELYATADVDLVGLQVRWGATPIPDEPLTSANFTLAGPECHRVTAGSYVLAARNPDTATNGGLPEVDFVVPNLQMANSDARYLLVAVDNEILDATTYVGTTTGVAKNLDPNAFDTVANDDLENWCPATTPYGAGDFGTPKAPNVACGGGGQCLDQGVFRDIVTPQVGDLVITELLPNSAAVADNVGEWFEVRANANVDLNGLRVGWGVAGDPLTPNWPTGSSSNIGQECLRVTTGSYVLFARNTDSAVNGGLPPVDVHVSNLQMANTGIRYLYIGVGDDVVDAVTYSGTTAGVARNLDPAFVTDPVGNDDLANWCAATTPYSTPAGNFGTPGGANLSCGG